jgi:hypothetical protein
MATKTAHGSSPYFPKRMKPYLKYELELKSYHWSSQLDSDMAGFFSDSLPSQR